MNVAVIGRGGHSRVISDLISSNDGLEIVGYLDDKYENETLVDNTFCGPITSAKKLVDLFQDIKFIVAIGGNKTRKLVVQKLDLPEEAYISIIHKSAVISQSSKIGNGTVVMPGAVINANAEIGHHSIINSSSVVEHDSMIGDFCHVCPGGILTGTVQVEEGSLIGAGATIIPNIKIGEWAVVGAGATVIENIPAHCTAVGVPAKVINNNMKVNTC